MENTKEQIMENKPLFFTRPKNAGALLLFALLALSRPEHTAALSEGDYTYSLISGNQAARVDGWTGSVANLVIPDTLGGKPVTEIGSSAFFNKTVLQSVSFPDSLTEIGDFAFFRCNGLTQVTLPASLSSIEAFVFGECFELKQIEVHSNNAHFSSSEGILFNKQKTELWQYPSAKSGSDYTIPGSVRQLFTSSFDSCTGLTQVTIPASLQHFGNTTFRKCVNLQTARFEGHTPDTVGSDVFRGTAADFKVQFYEGARGFTVPIWSPVTGDNYASEALPIPSFSIWRTLFGLETDLTAANGEPLLLAYALKLDPADAAARVPAPFVESGAFRLDFPADRSGVFLTVERTADLISGLWETVETVTNSDTASISIPLSGLESPDKLYLRFRASSSNAVSSLSAWLSFYGYEAGTDASAVRAASGEPLLFAYALNFHPKNPAARMPSAVMENGAFRLNFPLAANRSDVLLQVERTSDLPAGNWQPAETVTNSGTASISIPLAGSESPEKLYLRFTARQAE